ncbi:MAG: SURF1 family protein [Methyloceanibacter sp.]
MRGKGLVGLTACVVAALAVLIALGVWQLERLKWKEGLIAQIEARAAAAPVTLEDAETLAHAGRDPSYLRVRVEGRFHHGRELYLYASAEGQQGWHVITPLETAEGKTVLVDRGFVPDALRDPSSRALGQVEQIVEVTGLVRMPEKQGMFTPDNAARANRWFWRDLSGMSASMFPSDAVEVAPFFVEAERSEVPGGWPEGGQTRLVIVNNHLQSALTWFALAVCLVGVYAAYVWSHYRRGQP